MMASRNSPMAAAAPMRAARMTPIDWTMIGTSSTLPAAGPEYHPQARPTTRPPIRRPTPIFRLILLLTFALFLLITGAFTAYFGSGKSRKIGVGLLIGGLVVGLAWGWYSGPAAGSVELVPIIVQSIGVILAALIGAAAAIGLFLLAIMKS